jgi:signal transduction histidine kinase
MKLASTPLVRLLASAAGVLLLIALLTFLLLRGLDTHTKPYQTMLQALEDFTLAQSRLRRDVLQARVGLLRDYDPLGASLEAMDEAVARLRGHARAEGLGAAVVDRLAAMVVQMEELTERFKTSNALRQNSLSYVALLSTGFGAPDAERVPAASELAAALLYLTRDTSADAVAAVQKEIDRFAAQAPASEAGAEAAGALIAHARLMLGVLPEVDETLRSLIAVPSRQALEETRALFSDRQAAVEATAHHFRLFLYGASLLLLVALVRRGLQLRNRALAARPRAAFERAIAETSTRLINCPPAEIAARLEHVIGELGRSVGADRAYVVLAEDPIRVHAWSRDGTAYPPGWPERALTLFAPPGEIVRLPDAAHLPPSKVKDALTAAGIRGWALVPLIRPGRVRGIMGFDSLRPAWDVLFPLQVTRLAGDAVANAIEREFLERDRARLRARLERARRMQMIGTLASGIAHNFNNIIGAILGFSEMVEPQLAPGSRPAQHVDEIRRAAERGRDLIENILTFGRRRDARVRPVQVRSLLEEAASLLRVSLPDDVELIIDDVAPDVAVAGEPAQLQQVILNLGTNAVQAMEGGGSIRLTAEQKEVTVSAPLSHGELAPGRYVCLAVADTGRGFDERVARRIFEPFFTTRLAGTGLGLATVREIVRDHDGAMNVASRPGHGSRFEVWLPAAAVDEAAAVEPLTLPLGRGETVLIIESERERLLRDEEMVAALGYEPVGYGRPADAMAACRSAPDRFDVIVVGDASPGAGALDLAHALHAIAPRPPILLATVSTADVSFDAVAKAGISEVLRRPLVSTELAAALARCRQPAGKLRT